MKRSLLPFMAAWAAAGVAYAQAPLSLSLEPYGAACGPVLGASTADTERPAVRFEISAATPGGTLLVAIGTDAADLPLSDTACRLLTLPIVTVPVQVGGDGTAATRLELPLRRAGVLHAQAIELGASVRSSQGLTVAAAPAATNTAQRLGYVRVDGGHYVEFLQVEDDELLVVGGGSSAAPVSVERFQRGELDAVGLYRSLTGRPAPDALRDAQDRANRARALELPEASAGDRLVSTDAERGEVREPDGSSCFSTSWFTSNHCGGPSDFEYCWTNLWGDPWVQRRCYFMYGVSACVSGQYVFEYRRRNLGGWGTVWSRTVYTCEWYWVSGSGSRKHRRMHVKYGSGDHKHFSVRGRN